MQKDQAVLDFLEMLRKHLHPEAFDIVDYWEADPCAIGVAAPLNHSVLAYISTYGLPPDQVTVQLELPPAPTSDMPYSPAGENDAMDIQDAIVLIASHLSRAG